MTDLEEQDPEVTPGKRKKSGGERLFDRTVYTGIGFGVNEVSSIVITDQFVNGKALFQKIPGLKTIGKWFSKEGYDRASAFIAKTFNVADKMVNGVNVPAAEKAGNTLLMITLLSGGTLLILPMKWLEDRKIKLVEKANHFLDRIKGRHLTPEEVAERDERVRKDIACSPRQSWGSMMVGRLVAMCASVTTGTIVGKQRNDRLMDWTETHLTFKGMLPKNNKTMRHRYARMTAIETYSCLISSLVLEGISKITAKYNAKPHDPDLCEELSNKPIRKAADTEDTDKKEVDCGCAHKDGGFHAAKIMTQKTAQPVAAQI